jgi:hypothetical protein
MELASLRRSEIDCAMPTVIEVSIVEFCRDSPVSHYISVNNTETFYFSILLHVPHIAGHNSSNFLARALLIAISSLFIDHGLLGLPELLKIFWISYERSPTRL